MKETLGKIAKIAMRLDPVELVTPVNERDMRESFLNAYEGGIKLPPYFIYDSRALNDATKRGRELVDLYNKFLILSKDCPATRFEPRQERAVQGLIYRRIHEALQTYQMAVALQASDDSTLSRMVQAKYGEPDGRLIAMAYDLTDWPTKKRASTIDDSIVELLRSLHFDAENIAYFFRKALNIYGIKGWNVSLDDEVCAIDVRDKNRGGRPMVVIPSNRRVDGLKLLELIGHEIECHLRCTENSRHFWREILCDEYQPLVPLLAKSDDEFLYEGCAKRNDVMVSGSSAMPSPYYVIAIDRALRGYSFIDTFEVIAGLQLMRDIPRETAYSRAWVITRRIYRGISNPIHGGYAFTKDWAYFGGYYNSNAANRLANDFSSMTTRDIAELHGAGIRFTTTHENLKLCLDPWQLGII